MLVDLRGTFPLMLIVVSGEPRLMDAGEKQLSFFLLFSFFLPLCGIFCEGIGYRITQITQWMEVWIIYELGCGARGAR